MKLNLASLSLMLIWLLQLLADWLLIKLSFFSYKCCPSHTHWHTNFTLINDTQLSLHVLLLDLRGIFHLQVCYFCCSTDWLLMLTCA